MVEGIISLILSYLVQILLNPYFEKYTESQLAKGYVLQSFEAQLKLIELAIQIFVFLIVFGIIKLIRNLIRKSK